MRTSEREAPAAPALRRPGFLVSTAAVVLLLVAGAWVSIEALAGGGEAPWAVPEAPPPPSAVLPASPPGEGAGVAVTPSVCGLQPGSADVFAGIAQSTATALAPATRWAFLDVHSVPTSAVHGPAATAATGFGYCFEHSLEGAIFAAGNAVVHANVAVVREPWFAYVTADGPCRDQVLSRVGAPASADTRIQLVGYRVLASSAQSARVDVVSRVTTGGAVAFVAAVMDLVWAGGDWKLSTQTPQPVRMQSLTDVSGYVRWSSS